MIPSATLKTRTTELQPCMIYSLKYLSSQLEKDVECIYKSLAELSSFVFQIGH